MVSVQIQKWTKIIVMLLRFSMLAYYIMLCVLFGRWIRLSRNKILFFTSNAILKTSLNASECCIRCRRQNADFSFPFVLTFLNTHSQTRKLFSYRFYTLLVLLWDLFARDWEKNMLLFSIFSEKREYVTFVV